MTEGLDNKEYTTRYPAGHHAEAGADVFQRRTMPAAEPGDQADEEQNNTEVRSVESSFIDSFQRLAPKWRRRVRVGSALAAVLLIVYLSTKAYQVYRLSPEQLYAESFRPFVLRPMGTTDNNWSRFELFYLEGSMDSIIRAARRKVILSDKETFLAGMAYLVADDPFWSIRQLKKLSGQDGIAYAPQADFYLALAYLKNRDYDHALSLMLQIRRRPDHPYRNHFSDDFIERVKLLKWR